MLCDETKRLPFVPRLCQPLSKIAESLSPACFLGGANHSRADAVLLINMMIRDLDNYDMLAL
jgi:hypothetical protein